MALAQISVAGYQGSSEMGKREVKTRCGSGSPCRAPEVLVHTVTVSACLGRHAKHLQPLWHAEGSWSSPALPCCPRPVSLALGKLPTAVHPEAAGTFMSSLQRGASWSFLWATWLLVPPYKLRHPSTWPVSTWSALAQKHEPAARLEVMTSLP